MGVLVCLLLGNIFRRREKIKGGFRLGILLNKIRGKFVELKDLVESFDMSFEVLIDSNWKLDVDVEIFESSVCFIN